MRIVTLTSDYGTKDYHVAVIKGALLATGRPLQIVDISHEIENYNIVQAAFIFQNAWKFNQSIGKTFFTLTKNAYPVQS